MAAAIEEKPAADTQMENSVGPAAVPALLGENANTVNAYHVGSTSALSPAEARASIGYPRDAADDATKVASMPQKPAN